MSVQDELVVRDFLKSVAPFWQTLPYDFLECDDQYLDEMCIFPVPDVVLDAYKATRNNPDDYERDAGDYGKTMDHYWPGTSRRNGGQLDLPLA